MTVMTFRLVDGSLEADFVEADRRMQEDFAYRRSGLLRRTTAKSADGEWLVVELWESKDRADEAEALKDEDPVAQIFLTFIDPSTLQSRRYFEAR